MEKIALIIKIVLTPFILPVWLFFYLKPYLIASRLNCHYDGIQPGMGGLPDLMQFTDNVTHSTTYGNTFEEVREKLEKMRKAFKLG